MAESEQRMISLSGDTLKKVQALQQRLGMLSLSEVVRMVIEFKIDIIIDGNLDIRLL